jgi:hypothetical protein
MGRQRIDYYPDEHAVTTINSLCTRYAGGDSSSVLNRIVAEWAAHRPDAGGRALQAAGPDPAGVPPARGEPRSVPPPPAGPPVGSHAAWGEAYGALTSPRGFDHDSRPIDGAV